MKYRISQIFWTGAVAGWMLLGTSASAATFVVDFPRTAQPSLDPYYNTLDAEGNYVSGDGNSSVFAGVATEGTLSAELSARHYDSDALDPGTTGMLDSNLPWNRKDPDVAEPGWLVRFGLEPDSVGSVFHTHDMGGANETVVPASYISFHIKSPEEVVFEDITIQIRDVYGVGPSTIWAATSQDNFTAPQTGNITFNSDDGFELNWVWENLSHLSEGIEVRIYGFIGADEGTFGAAAVGGSYDPPPVPEPTASVLLGLCGLMLAHRRRR
jgi:hypothetical protein